jgi:transcriptional regulator with XRE-family HTH domain
MIKAIHMLIKELREKNGFSQSFVAQELGFSRPTYIQMEKGEREPVISELKKIADIFGVPLEMFFAEDQKAWSTTVTIDSGNKSVKKAEPAGQDIRIHVPQRNLEKFKEVLLYILGKVGAKPNVGETVIYKLLYFIDFDFYEKFEKQLIGATYIKNRLGPTPVEFKAIVDDMMKNKEIEIVRSKYFQYEQKKYLPLRSAKLNNLTGEEMEHIDDVLVRLSDKTAKELSEYSHEDIPWQVHEMGQPISYESVFYRGNKHSVKNYNDEL